MKQHHRHANKETSAKTLSDLLLDMDPLVDRESWDDVWTNVLMPTLTMSDDVTMDAVSEFFLQ